MKKKILIGLAIGVFAVVVIVVIVVGFFLGDVVKAGMETIGPKVTQTTLTVGSVHVGILTGSGGVKDLVLGNPDGYKSPSAISVGKAAVSVAPFSVLSDRMERRAVSRKSTSGLCLREYGSSTPMTCLGTGSWATEAAILARVPGFATTSSATRSVSLIRTRCAGSAKRDPCGRRLKVYQKRRFSGPRGRFGRRGSEKASGPGGSRMPSFSFSCGAGGYSSMRPFMR